MDWLFDLFRNKFILISLSSWFLAQVIKTVLYAIETKHFDWHRIFGDGGMPSGHSATVTSLAVTCAMEFGTDSFQFAIASIVAIIVCHDATGVRLETGKQAVIINEMLEAFEKLSTKPLSEANLKEFVGHTPIQVLAGILLGVCNAIVMYRFVI